MLKAQGYMSPENPEGRMMTDDVANEAALRYICRNIYDEYAMLFMDDFVDQQQIYGGGLVEYAKAEGLLPESWDKDLKQTEALLRSTADVLVCMEYKMPDFMQERVIYGLLERAKERYTAFMEEEVSGEREMAEQYRKAIEDGVRMHPNDYDYILDTDEDEELSDEEKLERKIEHVLDLVENPYNYENILFMDTDFLFMDELGLSESEIADTIGPAFGMSARTEKQQEKDMSFSEKTSVELMEKKVYPFFYGLAVRKSRSTRMTERQVREIADILMALKPATYIRYMYEDMFNGRVDDKFESTFKWVEDIWEQETEFLKMN